MAGACASRTVSNVAGAASATGGSFGNSSRVSKSASFRNVGGLTTNSERKFMSWGGANFFSRSAKLRGNAQFSRGRFQAIRAVGLDGRSQQAGGGFPVTNEESVNSSYQWSDAKSPRICILGGGFGGLYTALRLESLTWAPDKRPQVLLIDQSDRFVFKPMLYEILSKEVDVWEIAPSFSELLSNTRIKFIKDSVKSVSPFDSVSGKRSLPSAAKSTGGTVFLDGGAQVDYDWLVLALGAESRLNLVPGAVEYALPFGTLEDALEVDRRIVALERERFGMEDTPIEVVIVGSGYSGVELAATLAERFGKRGKVQVVDPHPDICLSAPAGNREVASRVLSSRNVQVELGYRVTSISESTTEGTSSEDNGSASSSAASRKLIVDMKLATQRQTLRNTGGRQLKADLVLWTIGTKALVPSRSDADYLAFPVNGRGQADTDETLRVRGHPRIFAIGDSAGAKDGSGRPLPATAQVAFQQADYAGWNIWAAINDRPLLPFRYQHLGEMMTLGTSDAAVTLGFIENVTLDGLIGHSARKLTYLYRFPKDDHKAKVALSWLAKSTINTFTFIQDELTKVLSPS